MDPVAKTKPDLQPINPAAVPERGGCSDKAPAETERLALFGRLGRNPGMCPWKDSDLKTSEDPP